MSKEEYYPRFSIITLIVICGMTIFGAILIIPQIAQAKAISDDWVSDLQSSTNCEEMRFSIALIGDHLLGQEVVKTAKQRMQELDCESQHNSADERIK